MEPLPEVRAAAERLTLLTDEVDLLEHLQLLSETVASLVPSCVGVSLTMIVDGEAYTLTSTSEEVAGLEAVQFLDDAGPCLDAALDRRDVRMDDVLDEGRWQLYEQAAGSRAVRSSLSIPVGTGDGPLGALNLYAGDVDAFRGRDELLAELFLVPVTDLVRNADLSFSTRDAARALPQRLAEKAREDQAAGVLVATRGWTTAEARARLRDASRRAGVPVARTVDLLLALDQPGAT